MIDEQQLNQFNISKGKPPRNSRNWSSGKIAGLIAVLILCSLLVVIVARVWHFYGIVKTGSQIEFVSGGGFTVSPKVKQIGSASSTKQGLAIDTSSVQAFGANNAPITIVQFADFECPFSKEAYPAVRELMNTHQDKIHFLFRQFPVAEIHAHALKAAEASMCANDQGKFWVYHDKLYQNQGQLELNDLKRYAAESGINTSIFSNCLSSGTHYKEVMRDYEDGLRAEVRGTPTFFVNGKKVEGNLSLENWEQLLDYLTK